MATDLVNKIEVRDVEKLKDSTNYQVWKFQITVILKAAGIMGIANGQWKKPTEKPEDIANWTRYDAHAQKTLIQTADKKILVHLMNCKTAAEMWKIITDLYEKDTDEQRVKLMEEFFNFTHHKGDDIMTHISKLENLYTNLNAVKGNISEEMLKTKIIATLPSNLSFFPASWDSTATDKRSLTNLKSRLIAEESRQKGNKEQEPVAFKAQVSKCYVCDSPGHGYRNCPKNNFKNKGKTKFCSLCKIPNHSLENCRKNKNRKNGEGTGMKPCSICKKTNHDESACFFRDKNKNEKQADKPIAFMGLHEDVQTELWVFDSGASRHMCKDITYFKEIVECDVDISVAKQHEKMKALGLGTVCFEEFILNDVYYVPQLSKNLLSISMITKNGGEVKFIEDRAIILKEGIQMAEAKRHESGLFVSGIKAIKNPSGSGALVTEHKSKNDTVSGKVKEWHRKLGHIGKTGLMELINKADGIELSKNDIKNTELNDCDVCLKAKLTRVSFGDERAKAGRILEIICSDVLGPIDPPTWDSKCYYVSFIDNFSGFCVIYLMTLKSEVFDFFKEYVAETETKFEKKIATLRCDNGGEYKNEKVITFCKNKGIKLDFTTPHSPQLNGVAERINRTIMEKVRAMLYDSNLDKNMWGEAAYAAVYLINRSPKSGQSKTPFEIWTGKLPNLCNIQIFGSVAYAKNLGHLKKLDERSVAYTFVGYAPNAYRLWSKDKNKIILSRDVIFPASMSKIQGEASEPVIYFPHVKIDEVRLNEIQQESEAEGIDSDTETERAFNENAAKANKETTRFGRKVIAPVRYGDPIPSDLPMILLTEDNALSYAEAVTGPDAENWKKAIRAEMDSLEKNETWKFVNKARAKGRKILSNRWVFKKKADGTFKARLVARGFEQGDLDFSEIFSPVVSDSTLKIIFALAADKSKSLISFDVASAFLYGDLREPVFMSVPEGYKETEKVCMLSKALYGLKQAPQRWNVKFTDKLKKRGLEALDTEKCIFVNADRSIILAIHVDDSLVLGNNLETMRKLLDDLNKDFKITIVLELKSFLGLDIEKIGDCITIKQTKYVETLLENFNMERSKVCSLPMLPNEITEGSEQTGTSVTFPYRKCVGSLLWLANKTRPDICFAVNYASRYLDRPTNAHVALVKRVLKYVNGTRELGIKFVKSGKLQLDAFCDADFAGDPETRKSTSGYIIFLNNGPISWASRKQGVVALSTTEAEYYSAAECIKELIYLKNVLDEITGENTLVVLHEDNQGALKLMESGVFNKRTKHIDVRYKFIIEKIEENLISLKYCPTAEQLADLLTKPLGKVKFEYFRNKILS